MNPTVNPTINPTASPTADPTTGACTEEFCASRAAEMDLPFQSVHKSNGAPRGCVMYRGGVTWVRNCVNHPNCGTTNCNGCEVIAACPAPDPIADNTYNPTLEPTINPTMAPTSDPSVNPTINPTASPTADPTTGACTEEFCASRAAEMDLPFQSVHKSNGAPRGCVM